MKSSKRNPIKYKHYASWNKHRNKFESDVFWSKHRNKSQDELNKEYEEFLLDSDRENIKFRE